jgi:hypothetical protein
MLLDNKIYHVDLRYLGKIINHTPQKYSNCVHQKFMYALAV